MAGVDLDGFELIVRDDFRSFNNYDGKTGLWSTNVVRDALVTNGPQSVFLDGSEVDRNGNPIGLDPISVKDGKLDIGSGVIPADKLAGVRDLLSAADQSEYSKGIKYYTGRISTADTWGQEYGYFEITAKVPEGKGHWSAFWMEPAGDGWPPEIDIFEAYGRGIAGKTGADNQFNQAVFFDRIDAEGNATQSVDITNPYKLDASGNPEAPDIKTLGGQEQAVFNQRVNAQDQFGIDIYNSFNTYAVKWTPSEITFYFGKDRESLVEVYRTPTPDDLDSPMVLIANDQISSTWDWNPVRGYDSLTFAEGNTLQIEQISIYAMTPERVLRGTTSGVTIVDTKGDFDTAILGTTGNDQIAPGHGLDFIDLTRGGSDVVYITRGVEGDVIRGFGADDVAVIEGWNIENPLERLTQVGNDVWLSNGSYPKNPQSLIFRDAKVGDFAADDFLVRWSETPNIWASRTKSNERLADTDGDGRVTALPTGSIMTDAGAYKGRSTLDGSDVGDRYYIYKSNTVIVENAGGGIDTVGATRSYTLGDNVENIVAAGQTNGSVLTGNGLGNRLESNGKTITFVGLGGDDLYDFSPGGANTMRVGAGQGHDVVLGFDADDVLVLEGLRFPNASAFRDAVSQTSAGVVIDLGEDQSVTFRNTSLATVLANTRYDLGASLFTASRGGPGGNYALPFSSGEGVVEGAEPPELAVFDNDIAGTAANDQLKGTNRTDRISGEGGNDNLNGGVGEDRLLGGAGNDNLTGSNDTDVLLGGQGNDRMTGGEGDDRLYGGDGSDRFIFNAAGSGRDVILDYADGDDIVALTGVRVQSVTDLNGAALVRLDQGGEIVFDGMTAAQVRDGVDFLLM